MGRFLFLPKQLPSHPWVDKDHLRQSLCHGQHKEKHLRKMSASSYTSRHSRWFGGPSKRSFPLTLWGHRKLLICGERRNSKFKRACSFGLACAFRRGRALQGFTSSALIHNTIALPIPNAVFCFKMHNSGRIEKKNLHISQKSSTFAPTFILWK